MRRLLHLIRYTFSRAYRERWHEQQAIALRERRGPHTRVEGEFMTCVRCRVVSWGWSRACWYCGAIA